LFESKTLGLGNKEVGIDEAAEAKSTPEEEDAGTKVGLTGTDQVGSDDRDNAVPQPVGSSGKSNTTGTDGKREDFSNKNPGTRTPGSGEEEDIDGNESNLGIDSREVVGDSVASSIEMGLVETNGDTNDGNDELADEHTDGTVDKHRTTTETLNQPEGDGSGKDVDKSEDKRHKEDIADSTGRLEERSRVVEDKVDTSPLLHHLKRSTENGLANVAASLEEGTAEAVSPRSEVTGVGDDTTFIFSVGNNFAQFTFNVIRGRGLTTDTAQSDTSFFDLSLLNEVTGRFGKEEKTSTKNDGEQQLQTNWDTVRARVGKVLGSVGDAGSKHKTNGDAELVSRDDSTTDLLGSDFGHVKNDDGRDETNTETSNKTTSNKKTKAS